LKIPVRAILFLVLIFLLGIVFYVINNPKTPQYSAEPVLESSDHGDRNIPAEPEMEKQDGPRYEGGPRITAKEDYLPAHETAVPYEMESEEDASAFDSGDIPPKVREIAEQLIELKDDFDDSTLKTVNKALDNVPYVDMEADDAELRPTGDGVKLKINIPADSVKKKK